MKKKFIFILEVPYWPFKERREVLQENKREKPKKDLLKLRKAAGGLLGKDIITALAVAGGVFWLAEKFDFTIIGAVILGYAVFALIKNLDSRISAFFALLFLAACPFLLIFKEEELAEFSAIYAYYLLVICVFQEITFFARKSIIKKFQSAVVQESFPVRKFYSFKKDLRISKRDLNPFRKIFWSRLLEEIGGKFASLFFLLLFFIFLRYYMKAELCDWAFYSLGFLFLVSLWIKLKNRLAIVSNYKTFSCHSRENGNLGRNR